jgi:hypothetical protein
MMQSDAVGSAQDSANAESRAAREQSRADLQPWVTVGNNALGMTADLSGANGADAATAAMGNFQKSPGYAFALDEGLRAVDAGAAARGMTRSGATIKAEEKYGQGLAAQDFSTYYNRLYNLSNQGQNSAAGQAATTSAAGSQIAQTDASAGSAQASIYGNTASGLSNIGNNYANQSLYQNRTNALYGGGMSSGSTSGSAVNGGLGGVY